jgi:hypothetical protein
MTYLPRLRDQFVAAAAPPRKRRRFAILGSGALTVLIASGALAATGVIPIGSPLPPSRNPYVTGSPDRGAGTIVTNSVKMTALRVPDPDGGPPWGMRIIHTTRGVGCVQAGRVVDGKLGVLGMDGVAGNDHRFHELSPTAVEPWECQPLDAAGNAFVTVYAQAFLASGPSDSRRCLEPGVRERGKPQCPARDVRKLQFGLLGPHAASVVYEVDGQPHSAPVTGPEGAFLIVDRNKTRYGGYSPSAAPVVGISKAGLDYPLRRVVYRDGSVCPSTSERHAIAVCPLIGYQRPAGTVPTSAQIKRPLTAHRRGTRVSVSFLAPVAITGAGSAYALETRYSGSERCRSLVGTQFTDRDIAAGTRVTLSVTIPSFCHGPVRGTVRLQTGSSRGAPGPGSVGDASPLVGTFKLP